MAQAKRIPVETPSDTREQLLLAAGELFAEKGFHGTTVREVCARAGANVAAVNYHFGDKQGLFDEAVLHAFAFIDRIVPLSLAGLTLPQQLHQVIRHLLAGFLDPSSPRWFFRLVHADNAELSPAMQQRISELLAQRFLRLSRIVAALTGLPDNDRQVRLHCISIVGMTIFFGHPGPRSITLPKSELCRPENIDLLADHIHRFALAGMGVTEAAR